MNRWLRTSCLLFLLILCVVTAKASVHFTEIGLWGGNCNCVAVEGNRAYVGAGNCLVVYDLTNPSAPARLGYVSLPDVIDKIAISGQYAYVACEYALTQIVDISDPAKPVILGTVGHIDDEWYGYPFDITGDTIGDISASGSRLYIACWDGVFEMDVSNPAQATMANYLGGCGNYCSLATYGDYLVYANTDYPGYLSVVDLSAPYWGDAYVGGLGNVPAGSLTVSGHYVYAACSSQGVKIIDLSDPANPVLTATVDTPGLAMHVAISGSYAYVADGSSGMQVMDISDPTHPAIVGVFPTSCFANRLAVSGNNVIIADSQRGFRIADVSTPSNPSTAYTCDAGGITDMAVIGNTALASNGTTWTSSATGLYTLDLSDPTSPNKLSWTSAPKSGELSVTDGRAYLFGNGWDYSSKEMDIFDVSDLTSPILLSQFNAGAYVGSIDVSGTHAYIGGSKKVSIVDLTNPSSPVTVGTAVSAGSPVYDTAVSNSYLYAGSYDGGLEVFNVSDPLHPNLVSTNNQFRPGNMLATDNTLYATGSSYPLSVFDISTPANPVQTGTFPIGGGDLFLSGQTLYASNPGGVAALDVSNPAMPDLIGQWQSTGGGSIVAVAGDIAYALSCGTVRVLKMEQGETSTIYGRVRDAQGVAMPMTAVSVGGISSTTDYDGYYVLGDFSAADYTISASSPGWTTQNKAVTLVANQSVEVDFTMPLGTIVGTVADNLGNPVSGASIEMYGAHGDVGGDVLSQTTIVTGPDGRYTIPDVYPGDCNVAASQTGYDRAFGYTTVTGGQTSTCNITLPKHGAISGHVMDPRGGPIKGVKISYASQYTTYSAATDSNGGYMLPDLSAGAYELNVWQGSQNITLKKASVAVGTTTTCDFTLPDRFPMAQVGSCNLGSECYDIWLLGTRAYVACADAGLKIVDVSNPENPTIIGVCDTPGTATDVTVEGGYAYVADDYSGLQVIDVHDPTHPALVGTCATPGRAFGVAVQGDYAYVSNVNTSLQIISVQNPCAPTIVGQFTIPARNILFSGGCMYVSGQTNYWGEVNIMDFSDPRQLRLQCKYYADTALDVAVSGNLACVCNAFDGFDILDVSNPSKPARVCGLDTYFANAVCIADGRAFIADATGGLLVYDVSDPASPILVGTASSYTSDVAVSGDYIYADDVGGSFIIYDMFRPAVTGNAPNTGYNDATVNMTGITGRGFKPGCGVKLTRPGQPDIVASSVASLSASITCAFDLRGVMPGYWTVCVTNPDGKTGKGSSTSFLVKVSSSAPKLGLRATDISQPVTATAARNHRCVVWGKVISRSSTRIQIDDGSRKLIAITGSGFSGISVGGYISACGTLEPNTNPPCLFCQQADIVKYK